MGEGADAQRVPDATGGRAADRASVRSLVTALKRCEAGATAIEYAIIAAGIAAVIVPVIYLLGSTLNTALFERVASAIGP